MSFYLFLLIFISVVILLISALYFFITKNKYASGGDKDRNQIIKYANKRLAQNPKDTEAVSDLANLYYNEDIYDKAVHLLKVLLDQTSNKSQA